MSCPGFDYSGNCTGSREAALAWAFRCGAFTTFNALDPEITHVTQLNKGFPLRVPFLNSLYSIY